MIEAAQVKSVSASQWSSDLWEHNGTARCLFYIRYGVEPDPETSESDDMALGDL